MKEQRSSVKTLYILIVFCFGMLIGHRLYPAMHDEDEKPAGIVSETIKESFVKLAAIDTAFSARNTVMEKRADSLTQTLKAYKFLLSEARGQLQLKRNKTGKLITAIKRDTIFTPDPLLLDSLELQISAANTITDSVITACERNQGLWEDLVAVRDSQLIICNDSYVRVKNFSEEQLFREQKLTEELNTLLKQQKRRRIKNRALAGGMLFISGIATTILIKSH